MSDFPAAMRMASRLIAAIADMEPALFTSPKKGAPAVVQARHLLVYLLHTEGQFQQATIADALHRHHSTVKNSIEVISGLREDPAFDAALEQLGAMFRTLQEARARVVLENAA